MKRTIEEVLDFIEESIYYTENNYSIHIEYDIERPYFKGQLIALQSIKNFIENNEDQSA